MNPIEVIQKVMKMGILGLVLPEGQALSQGETDVSFLASKRELQSGFGMAECGKELSFVDKMHSVEISVLYQQGEEGRAAVPGGICALRKKQ